MHFASPSNGVPRLHLLLVVRLSALVEARRGLPRIGFACRFIVQFARCCRHDSVRRSVVQWRVAAGSAYALSVSRDECS